MNDVGVDDRDADEDDALEVPGEHPKQREQGVAAEPAVAADEEDRDRLARDRARRAACSSGLRAAAVASGHRPRSPRPPGEGSSLSSRRIAWTTRL